MSADIDMSQYLKAFSVGESKKKIDEVDMILNRKIGTNWKTIIFLMLIVMVCIILLIIYGINIDNNPYKNTLSHIKVFFIILLISISFFFIWLIIKPSIDNVKKGVVPFPPSDTLVPVDSTQCGIFPTLCTNQQDCISACTDKNGKCYYSCQEIKHPNTYYLGTKLEVGKSYCLPNIAQFNDIQKCGTYTGRIVWAKNPDGTLSWQCQCLYPDLFGESDCTYQSACKMENDNGKTVFGSLKDSKGNIFSASDSPPGDVKTPYDLNADGTPRFKCSCIFEDNNGYSGFYSKDDDPFTCNKDICASGVSTADDAKFDPKTNTCICKNPMVKSNISGFCYPPIPGDTICNLNPNGNGCRYGVDLFFKNYKGQDDPVIFSNNGRYYMADKRDTKSDYLLDITDLVNSSVNEKSSFIDITNTIFKDAFYSYTIKTATPDYLSDIIGNLQTDMMGTLKGIAQIALFETGENLKSGLGLARKCNSYYNKWDGVSKNCEDPLSTTGTEPLPISKPDCGDGTPVININHYPWGYNCDCGVNSRKDPGCGKVLTGPHTVDNDDKTGRGQYQVTGEYIDRIVCNDVERAQQGLPPQPCIQKGKCIEDGTDLASGQGVENCCFYEKDEKNNGIANFRTISGWIVPTTTLYDGGKKQKCGKRARSSCSSDDDCTHDKGLQYGCSYMDKGNSGQICCPKSSYEYSGLKSTGYWCDHLDTGDRCYYNAQCQSGTCNNSPSGENIGGGTCA